MMRSAQFTAGLLVWIGCIFFLAGCDRGAYSEVRRSLQRGQSEARRLQGDVRKLSKLAGDEKVLPLPKSEEDTAAMAGFSPMAQRHLLNRYDYLYNFINPESQNKFSSGNISWDSVQHLYTIRRESQRRRNPHYEVFGWHPYWMGSAWESYSFNLLSTVAYFAYKVNPETGRFTNPLQIEEWRNTAMIDSAQAQGCRVLLTIANHGAQENTRFLENELAWQTLVDELAGLINERRADGVDINFEQLPENQSRNFIRFVAFLRSGIDARIHQGKAFISLTLPSYSSRKSFDVEALQPYCDLLVIMGYAFHAGKENAGPVAPMRNGKGGRASLIETMDHYQKTGLDPAKTVLALPYYAAQWRGERVGDASYASYFDRELTYREVMQLYNRDYIARYDPVSMSNYYFLEFPDGSSAECWYDDAYTLNKKYNLALDRGLKGVGIWALGYDNGYTELWDLLETKFTSDTIHVIDPIAEAEGYPIRLGAYVLKNKRMLLAAFLFYAMSVVLALLIAFRDWKVRESIFGNQLGRFVFMSVLVIFVIPLLGVMDWFGGGRWVNLLAFLSGAALLYVVMRMQFTFHSGRP